MKIKKFDGVYLASYQAIESWMKNSFDLVCAKDTKIAHNTFYYACSNRIIYIYGIKTVLKDFEWSKE